MSDWAVGDLAVCVDATPRSSAPWGSLSVGQVCTVLHVSMFPYGLVLLVEGAQSGHPSGGYRAIHFRKVLPDKHEACETEFVKLLKRSKQTVTATASDWLLRAGPVAKQLNDESKRDV